MFDINKHINLGGGRDKCQCQAFACFMNTLSVERNGSASDALKCFMELRAEEYEVAISTVSVHSGI